MKLRGSGSSLHGMASKLLRVICIDTLLHLMVMSRKGSAFLFTMLMR